MKRPEFFVDVGDESYKTEGSVQQTPEWCATFIRFSERNTFTTIKTGDFRPEEARDPLFVYDDLISLNVEMSKASLNKSCSLTLAPGKINYLTSIAPGDYFIVNIVNSTDTIDVIRNNVNNAKPINKDSLGFRGLFRVQSVHKRFMVSETGAKMAVFQVSGYAFVEFLNSIYYNPYLINRGLLNNDLAFLQTVAPQISEIIANRSFNPASSVQDIVAVLIDTFIGRGPNNSLVNSNGNENLEAGKNSYYKIPDALGPLMSRPKAKYAGDLVNFIAGVQQYESNENNLNALLPSNLRYVAGNFWSCKNKVKGSALFKPDLWNNVKLWDILNSYLNPTINELYTCFKPSPKLGKQNVQESDIEIMPTVYMREKPFTSTKFAKNSLPATQFLNLPTWVVRPELIFQMSIGRDDAARINFVQVFGRNQITANPDRTKDFQISQGNFQIDKDDVIRSGLRPLIQTSNFDFESTDVESRVTQAPYWASLISDWTINGHLKLSGSISCLGIYSPISPGDNVLFDDNIFHLEAITYSCQVQTNGVKTFRTSMQLSNGIPAQGNSAEFYNFSEMEVEDYQQLNSEKFQDPDKKGFSVGSSHSSTEGESTRPTQTKPFLNKNGKPIITKKLGSKPVETKELEKKGKKKGNKK